MRLVQYGELLKLTTDYFIRIGLSSYDSKILSENLVTAELHGVTSHGLQLLKEHSKKINQQSYNLSPDIKIINHYISNALVDGDNSIGPLSAYFCSNLVIEECKNKGMFLVNSYNNNTYGAAFVYSLLMAQSGLIGITFSNSPAQMPLIGGKERLLGTNPFSVVIPNGDEPIIIDMASSVVAKSKFKERQNAHQLLDEGWALDKEGRPTIDPKDGIEGLVLPMAGYKGLGIAIIIDIISGLLSRASFLDGVGSFYDNGKSMNVGFCMIGINPKYVFGDGFEEAVRNYVKRLRSSKTFDENTKAIIPGDNRLLSYKLNIENGIPLTDDLYQALNKHEQEI